MKSIRHTGMEVTVFGEIFESPREMLKILDTRPHVFDDQDFLDDESRASRYWNGFETGKELKEDFQKCKVKKDTVKTITDGIKVTATEKRVKFFNNVQGFAPVVPLALMGVPNSMIDQRSIIMKSKIVNIYANISTCGDYSASEIAEAGKELVKYIVTLEQAGYRVGLTAFWGTYNGEGTVSVVGLKVKDPSQPLDIQRCAYPFVNPSFHRGICYGWYQRTDGFNHDYGYGQVPNKGSYYAQDISNALNVQNGVVVYFADILREGQKAVKDSIEQIERKRP